MYDIWILIMKIIKNYAIIRFSVLVDLPYDNMKQYAVYEKVTISMKVCNSWKGILARKEAEPWRIATAFSIYEFIWSNGKTFSFVA